jgi:hypothetical protein
MAQLDYMASARPASGRPIVLAVLVVLTAAAYEAAAAFGWLSVGPEPGQAPVGNGLVLGAALLALIAGAGLCVLYASHRRPRADALGSLIAPTAAAFVVARFYSFDPYYAPTLRRMWTMAWSRSPGWACLLRCPYRHRRSGVKRCRRFATSRLTADLG